MKSDKIAIEFDTNAVYEPTLIDFPSYCEVVHVSGEASERGPGIAHLHINLPDKPSNARTAKAFFVVADGVDVPGFVISKGKDYGAPHMNHADEDIEPTFVRRVGKFTTPSGSLFFVFERL